MNRLGCLEKQTAESELLPHHMSGYQRDVTGNVAPHHLVWVTLARCLHCEITVFPFPYSLEVVHQVQPMFKTGWG